MTRQELCSSLRSLSAGTIANIVGSPKYAVIDMAITVATLYAYEHAPESEVKAVKDYADICNFVRDHWKEAIPV